MLSYSQQHSIVFAGAVLFFILLSLPLTAQSADEDLGILPPLKEVISILSQEHRETLLRDGQIILFRSEVSVPILLPQSGLSERISRQIIRGQLNMGTESLFFAPIEVLPEAYALADRDERNLRLYNILRSVSTLTGLEYYSASRKKMRLLFVESWAIENPSKPRKALPDPLVESIPSYDRIFIHQKDKSFANNESEMSFFSQSNTFSATIINLSSVFYKGLLKVVHKGNMQTHFLLVPVQEGLLVYTNMSAKTINAPYFHSRARDSFTNRVIALRQWYQRRVSEEF